MNYKKNQEISIKIDDCVYGYYGAATLEGQRVLVRDAIPGDVVRVRLTQFKGNNIYVKELGIEEKSPHRQKSDCPHFPTCGGCAFRDVKYEYQLELKTRIISNELGSAGITQELMPIIPSPNQQFYRNKMEFSFGEANGKIVLGLHKKNDFASIVDTPQCLLQSAESNIIRKLVTDWANANRLTMYDPKRHLGNLRHLLIREGKNTGQILVALVAAHDNLPVLQELVNSIKAAVPALTGFLLVKNNNVSDKIDFQSQTILYGQAHIEETLGDKRFYISPTAFFQTNSLATGLLYSRIKETISQYSVRNILDLFCGTGSIGIYIADKMHSITGVELEESAVKNAIENKKLNNLEDITFYAQDAYKFLREQNLLSKTDLVILDPPRSGLNPKIIKMLTETTIPYILYISCNPRLLAADLDMLKTHYQINFIQPLDLFPHTPHLESITLLVRK